MEKTNKSYGNFLEIVQIFQQLFVSCFSISMAVPLKLQISSFCTDLIYLQNKAKYYRKAEQINLVSKCCIILMIRNTRTKRTFALKEFLLKINLLLENYLLPMTETSEVHQFQQHMEKMYKNSSTK